MTIKVTLHLLENAGPKQLVIASRACELLEQAVNDPRFVPEVLDATYLETRVSDPDGSTRSVPVKSLPEFVLQGLERGTAADAEIDLKVVLDGFRRGILGSTLTGVLPFRTAYWFINDCIKYDEPAELAGHFMHEWLHVCGFYHWPNNSARDDVAYNLGNIVRKLARGDAKSESAMPDWLNGAECGATVTENVVVDSDADDRML